jgi:hypothetical protein
VLGNSRLMLFVKISATAFGTLNLEVGHVF